MLIMVILAVESQEKKAQEFLPSCYQIIVEIGFTFSSLLQGFFFAIPRKFLFSPVLRVEFKWFILQCALPKTWIGGSASDLGFEGEG